jgi:outer membrane protein assembly factor BamD (BamD/ComL family)
MKFISAIILGLTIFGLTASAQRNVTPAVDTVMETDAKHNLDVARQAFTPLKKAYKQVILRFEETYAAYPDFTGIDEFLYLAGMSSYYLSEGKGKQKVDLKSEKEREKFAPEKLRADARTYLTLIVDKYPQSKYRDDAEKTLKRLGAEKFTNDPNEGQQRQPY